MTLLQAFRAHQYANEIGPGVYDIHSPRVPSAEEMRQLLELALQVLKPEQLWVNPDCGLKTRGWPRSDRRSREYVPGRQRAAKPDPAIRRNGKEINSVSEGHGTPPTHASVA